MNCKKAKLLSVLLLSIFATVSLYASGLKNSAPVVKRKPIMTVEYEYSRSGRITARKINGARQNYKYDKKGQLLGVYDGKGNAIEEYVYDPAGNILKKTIQGKTTTYKYDKANQLVLSECNGKITKYEYDAAGRLVKEGDKVYSYIGLDKIESVTENGRRLSSFTYHIDGQLAARVSIESSEEFQWDGLALIQRNSTNYVNEPAVTGGNPILADDKVLFNDMLGTTLGIKDGDKVMQNNLTAFGESLSTSPMESSFFTGKPHVGEMGYVFLFRAYRADQGKWQTSDPLGYPDGWNNFAYVNNRAVYRIDLFGLVTIFIGGASEHTSTGTMGNFMNDICPNCGQMIGGGESPYAWTDKDEIIAYINSLPPNEPITIVGHSYGGDTAYLVARDCGRSIDALVTFDAVSNFTYNITPPSDVAEWYNIYVTGGNYGLGDLIADIGGHWGNIDGATNIGVPDIQHGDVAGMMNYVSENGYSNLWGLFHVCE